jgi:hypothetical protein
MSIAKKFSLSVAAALVTVVLSAPSFAGSDFTITKTVDSRETLGAAAAIGTTFTITLPIFLALNPVLRK